MAHETIILVAPEESLRQVTSDILNSYRVMPARSEEEAFGILREAKVDLLIVNLPFQELPSICTRIHEVTREVPALYLIHPADLPQSVGIFKGGVSSVVLKPFTKQELLSRVEESLWKVRLLNENVRLKLLFPLYEMTQNLFIGPKLPDLFRQIVSIVMRETGGDFVFLSLLRNSDEVLFQDFKSKPGCHVSDLSSFSKWISRRFHFLRAPLSVGEEGLGDPEILEKLRAWGLSSLMIYPLVSRFNLSGFLIVGKNREKQFYRDGDGELLSIIGHQLSIVLENYGLVEELENSHFESLKALASAIEAKDTYTSGHCDRLVDYSYLIAERMKLNPEEKKLLRYGAALHDIGKIGIRESILGKPGKLTSEEYEEMKKHPRIGAEMLRNINFLRPVAPIIYHHQECFDGSGYPDGLSGDHIPLFSRIVAILDTFDAMTTDRPYRRALSVQTALDELIRYSGKQFDPQLVRLFHEIVQDNNYSLNFSQNRVSQSFSFLPQA